MKNLALKDMSVQELNTNEMSMIEAGGLIGDTVKIVRRLGLTEYEAVKEMYDGITELIKLEKTL